MSRDIIEGEADELIDTGENLRFWLAGGDIVNMPFRIAAAAPELLRLLAKLNEYGPPWCTCRQENCEHVRAHQEAAALVESLGVP